MKPIGDFNYAQTIKRGSEVIACGIRLRVTHVIQTKGGGMGEYPPNVTIVLEDGSVWAWDAWTPNYLQPRLIAESFRNQEPGF